MLIEMGRYLVTGVAGFIGSALAKRLISNGDEVVTIDNLSTGYQSNIPDGVTFINKYDKILVFHS